MQPALTPLERQQMHVARSSSPTFWHRVRFAQVRAVVERTAARSVVDLGAGSGLLGDEFRATSVRYRFSESSPSLAADLADRFGVGAELESRETIRADTVVAVLDVIEHVVDDASLLRSIHDRMEPGATIVVTVPAMTWLFSSWDADLGHHRRYARRDAADVVAAAGFEVEESTYLFPELVPVALLRRWRRSDGTAAEFPDLPAWIDRIAMRISSATARRRRFWPLGTSVLVVARRTGTPV